MGGGGIVVGQVSRIYSLFHGRGRRLDDPFAGNECSAFKILRQAPFANGEYNDNEMRFGRELSVIPPHYRLVVSS